MTPGERLRELREAKGLTRYELRDRIGKISYQSIVNIELDVVKPSLRLVGKFCNALGLEPEEFFKGVEL